MSVDSADIKEIAASYFHANKHATRRASLVEKLNKTNFYYNRNKKTTGEYEAFYSANNFEKRREIKLFSFQKKKIMTLCTSAKEAKKQLQEYNAFHHAYCMPRVEENHDYPNALEVAMIENRAFPGDAAALTAIIDGTVQYNSSCHKLDSCSIQELITFSYDNPEINALLKTIASRIDQSFMQWNIPICIQHGDLSKENLIYGASDGKTGFWWIDWEHARDRVFFYDYFFYIINSALYYDTKALEYYMSGESNASLETFFSHFGMQFLQDKKADYFMIFAIIFLKERVCDVGRVAALKQYCDFIGKHFGENI